MQEAAGAQLDATINERVTHDLNVSTQEERKGGEIIDVSKKANLNSVV